MALLLFEGVLLEFLFGILDRLRQLHDRLDDSDLQPIFEEGSEEYEYEDIGH